MDTTELQVGDEIAYCTSSNYCTAAFLQFGKVAKITKTGLCTLTNGRRYNRQGRELRSCGGRGYLLSVESAKATMARDAEKRAAHAAVKSLEAALDGRRNGFGEYSLDASLVAEIRALTERILA